MKYKYLLLATGLLWGTSTVNAQWRSASEAPVRQQPEISKTVKNQGDGKVLYFHRRGHGKKRAWNSNG